MSKDLARKLWHGVLRARQRMARRMIAGLHRQIASGARQFPWSWRLLHFIYLAKRFVQDSFVGGPPLRAAEFRFWRRRVEANLITKLHVWATRPAGQPFDSYLAHASNNRVTERDAEEMRRLAHDFEFRPLISILTPVYNAPAQWLGRLVETILQQTYDRWELILVDDASTSAETKAALDRLEKLDERITVERLIGNVGVSRATNRGAESAHGEFIAFVDHDDELKPDALWCVVDRLQTEPECDLIYSDEELAPEAAIAPYPYFKPDFSPELLSSFNYICHFVVLRKSIFDAVGRLRPHADGAQDFDLVLRIAERTDRIAHIPRVLYRWNLIARSLSRTADTRRREVLQSEHIDEVTAAVVQDHYDRIGWHATTRVRNGWVLPRAPLDKGKVSIIICTRDHPWLLYRAVRSIEKRTDYPNFEIVIVDNGSQSWLARWMLDRLSRKHKVLRMPSTREDFNFARLNNDAAKQVDGKYLLFLNDDTKVRKRGWLSALVGYATRPGVGAVGARLLYPDRTNQHAGVIMGAMGWGPWHALMGVAADTHGYFGYLSFPHNCIAVTAACMLTPRGLFLELGGFDEQRFAVGFNDVDYCLRAGRAGYRCVYAPQAELIHYEGRSRGPLIDPKELARLRELYLGTVDPYWNVNCRRETPHFGIAPRRQARWRRGQPDQTIEPPAAPKVLVVAAPSTDADPWPHWEAIVEPLEAQGRCEFDRLLLDPSAGEQIEKLVLDVLHTGPADVVLAHDWTMHQAIRAAKRAGIPSIWHLPRQPLPARWNTLVCGEHLQIARTLDLPYQVVFGCSHSLACAAHGQPRHNFVVIDGVLTGELPPAFQRGAERSILRTEWGFADETVVILAIVPLNRDGAAEVILDAYARLSRRLRRKARSFLLMVGAGAAEFTHVRRLRQRIAGIGRDVGLVVDTEPWQPYFAAADLFVSHQPLDLRSQSALFALEHGLPIVGPSELARADLLYPDSTGLKFTSFRPGSLSRALESVLRHPAVLPQFGGNGRAWLNSRAHPTMVLDSWAELFREAAELRTAAETPLALPVAQPADLTRPDPLEMSA